MDKNATYRIIKDLADGVMPVRYRNTVKQWIVGDPDDADKEAAFKRVWEDCDPIPDSEELAEALDVFRTRREGYEHNRKRLRLLRYAVAVILPIVGFVAVWHWSAATEAANSELLVCYVANGATDSLRLTDGTLVRLNAGTTFFYPRCFSKKIGRASCRERV